MARPRRRALHAAARPRRPAGYYPAGALALDVVGSGFFGSIGLHATLGAEQAARARECLERLLPGCAGRTLAELSYGMQRLVFIARALVADPPLLVLDEPCQGLDSEARARVLAAVDGAVAAGRTTLLYVTHQADEIPGSISHVLELRAGRVVRSINRTANSMAGMPEIVAGVVPERHRAGAGVSPPDQSTNSRSEDQRPTFSPDAGEREASGSPAPEPTVDLAALFTK